MRLRFCQQAGLAHVSRTGSPPAEARHGSLVISRQTLMGPTFVAIALGMLINLGTYESMIAEALHTGILFYLSGQL